MSTANIKPPIIIRKGYTSDWNEVINPHFRIVKCELQRFFLSITHFQEDELKIEILFYKWLQRPYILHRRLQKNLYWKRRYSIKSHLLNYWKKKRPRFQTRQRRNYYQKLIFKAKMFCLPVTVITHLENQIGKLLLIKNIYQVKKIYYNHKFINLVRISKQFLELRSLGNPKYLSDALMICDLLSVGLCKIDLLVEVISRALARNSHRGKRREFLIILRKLPYFINSFDARCNRQPLPIRNWDWIIKVTGKLTASGRTSSFYIRPSFLALHTIMHHLCYEEFNITLKPGTFSIKIWFLNHY